MPLSIALIGFGAIGRSVYDTVLHDPELEISKILVRPRRQADLQAELGLGVQIITDTGDLEHGIDFVLECAGHAAVKEHAEVILRSGVDLGIVSIGVLANETVLSGLEAAAKTGGSQLTLLPGAIGGIDAIAAAGADALDEVRYIARKPPMSWSGSPADATHILAEMTQATEIFSGTAREAAIEFPKNANVVATVALAGIGFDATRVALIADPAATGNSHEIAAKGPLLDLNYTTCGGALPGNPKTSALTAMSAVRALKNRLAGLVV